MITQPVQIDYFSDLLCVWAYVAQVKIDELRRDFGDDVRIVQRFVPVFGSVANKIGAGWADRGGLEGYARHVHEVASRFDHVGLHTEVWTRSVPAGSYAPHAFVRAVTLVAEDGAIDGAPQPTFEGRTFAETVAWQLRLAMFRDAKNIARLDVQLKVAAELGLPVDAIRERVEGGTALSALAADHELAARHQVVGSPTYLINEGRQRLYGNVGYKVIEANVRELLRDNSDKASWC